MRIFLAIAFFLFSISCSETKNNSFLKFGWEDFEKGNYSAAIINFEKAIDRGEDETEIETGIAWSHLKLENFSESFTFFNSALGRNKNYKNAISGLGILNYENLDFQRSALILESLLEMDPAYSFEYDSSVNPQNIHLLLAHNYFILQDYEKSFEHLSIILPELTGSDAETIANQLASFGLSGYE